jgi:hypothetical protein
LIIPAPNPDSLEQAVGFSYPLRRQEFQILMIGKDLGAHTGMAV